MHIFRSLGVCALIATTATIPVMAQGYTLPAPPGVRDGSKFILFGQGWKGEQSPENPVVRGGRITIPGDIGATSIFGNFILPDGSWLKVQHLPGIPKDWAARIIAGYCEGDPLACDGVEDFLGPKERREATFALVAPITTNGANSSFTVSVQAGQACLQLPSKLNSISFSGAGGSRSGVGLPTGGPKGLVNVGKLLSTTTPVGVVDNGQGSAQTVPLTNMGGNRWCFFVQQGQVFQFAYKANGGGIQAWSTVGAARIPRDSTVIKLDGNAPLPVGPFAYQAQ